MIDIFFAYVMSNETHEYILLLLSSALCCLPRVFAGHLHSTEKGNSYGLIDAFGWSTGHTCLENCHHVLRQKIFLPQVRSLPPHPPPPPKKKGSEEQRYTAKSYI